MTTKNIYEFDIVATSPVGRKTSQSCLCSLDEIGPLVARLHEMGYVRVQVDINAVPVHANVPVPEPRVTDHDVLRVSNYLASLLAERDAEFLDGR